MKRLVALALAVLATTLGGAPAVAHHAGATVYGGTKAQTLTGVLTRFEAINPHSWLYVDATDAKGKVTSWEFELPPPSLLRRFGFLKPDVFVVGKPLTLNFHPARDGRKRGSPHEIVLADGRKLPIGLIVPARERAVP